MKHCGGCDRSLAVESFAWRNRERGTRSAQCRACHKAYAAQHYQRNPEPYKERARKCAPQQRESARLYGIRYLLTHPCVDCGEADIEVLEFDHIESVGSKARRVWGHHTIASMRREIEKCEVRCANCHVRRTRRQIPGWSRRALVAQEAVRVRIPPDPQEECGEVH